MNEEIPFCDLRAAHLERAEATESALLRVARSGRYVTGPELEAFEDEFAAACAAPHAVGVGSGTAALALILRAVGIGPGDEVIVPAYTAAATWMAVALVGARPIGADVDPDTGLLDPAAAAAALGPRTRALVAVHLFGRLAPMGALRSLTHRRGLRLIEDAAHASGVDEGQGPAGSLADAAAFSFYPTKSLGGLGDGGAVVTGDGELAGEVRRLRSYGWETWQGDSPRVGGNSRLDEIQAAVLRERLKELPAIHRHLRSMAGRLRTRIGDHGEVRLPEAPASGEAPWHQFVVRHPRRDELRRRLSGRGIGTALHYAPLPHRLSAFAPLAGRFGNAEALAARAVSLPFDSWLRDDQLERIAASVAPAGGRASPIGSSSRSVTWSPRS